uniref:FRY like transcription coactivator n=1 Tax=Loxodonta africana TaxID=9785 RepID=G3UKA5_LOXAF
HRLESRYSSSSGGSYEEEKSDSMPLYSNWRLKVMEHNQGEPLPFPPAGGCWSPLVDYLPETSSPGLPLHRCNIAVILLTDLIIDHSVKVEWGSYLHLLLHAVFIGFDHCHPEVYEHCKRLLLHLLIVMGSNSNVRTVASILLRNKEFNEPRVLTVKQIAHLDYSFTAGVNDFIPDYQPSPMTDSGLSSSSTSSSISLGNNSAAISHLHTTLLNEVDISVEQDGKVKTLMEFITSRKRGPLWNHEDVSAKNPSIKSAEQLTTFLKHVVSVFKQSSSEGIHLEHHLSEVALQTALSCSSRHYAGRSFQIFRALKQPLSATTLSDVLSRLVETVGDPGEDAQGFVIELLLTLESAIDTLAETMKHYDLLSALSQPSYHDPIMGNKYAANRKSTGQLNLSTSPINSSSYLGYNSNARSNSLRLSLIGDRRGDRQRSNTLDIMDGRINHSNSLARTRSLSSLREKGLYDVQSTTEPTNLMATIFWIAASLLESDYEYEYLLALRLLNKLLIHLPLDKSESREKIENVQSKLKWSNFPGLQQLFLKGFTSVSTQEMTVHLLSKLIAVSKHTLVDPSQLSGFPLNILCLLPHLIQHFDSPTQFCKETASRIAKVCAEEKCPTLVNLAHMMSLYSTHTYSRDCSNWINVVCRYLHDSFSDTTFSLVTYLAESVSENNSKNIDSLVIPFIFCILSHQITIMFPSKADLSFLLKDVYYVFNQSPYWKEALNILKLVVSRSASLVVPSDIPKTCGGDIGSPEISFTKIFNNVSKELPGKTLDFHFDISETPIIGNKYGDQHSAGRNGKPKVIAVTRSTSSTSSGSNSNALVPVSWKRPQLSQRRTREKLMNVLSLCGPESGLPKNPSVVFSSNEDLEVGDQQTSLISTTEDIIQEEEVAVEDNSSEQQFGVFKDFDFLDVELEDAEGESMDNFNWGVRRRSLDSIDKGDTPSLQEYQCSSSTPSLNLTNQEDTDESSEEEAALTASQILSRTQMLNNDSPVDETMPDHSDLLLQSQDSTSSATTEEVLQIRDETPSLEASLDNANSQLPEDISSALKEEQAITAFEDEGSYIIQEQQDSLVCQGILDLEETEMAEPLAPESYPESICEEDVTLALKELDERCEEEEADFSGLSSQDEDEQDGFPEVQTSPLPSPFLSAIIAAFQPVAYDDEEEAWRCHVNQMLSDTDGSCAVFTFHVFSRLFQTIQRKFGDVTNEAVSFLGESLQRIGTKFKSSLEVMMMCSECPTVFVDAETLMSCGLLETFKFSVLELQEHLDTYNAKREAAEQWLDNCKRTFGAKEDMYRMNADAEELELCRRLYKLHFQLLLLFQAYCKLINQVNTIKNEAEVINMSEELAQLESILKEAESASETEEIDISKAAQTTIETAIHSLIETLKNKEFISAVAQVKAFRTLWPSDIFGSCDDDPVQTLLHIYFHHQTLGQGSFAVIGSNQDMSEANYKLMELNLEIRESLRTVQSYQLLAQAKPIGNLVSTGF